MTDEAELDVDAIVAQLQARVEERRRQGFYPPDLDAELHEHQRRIAQFRSGPDVEPVLEALAHLDRMSGFSVDRIQTASRVPGGKALHEAVAKATSRQTAGVLEQVQVFADAVRRALRAMLVVLEQPHHVHADLLGQLDAVFDRMAAFERGPASSEAAVADLRRRVEELEVAERRRRFEPFYDAADFAEPFRGSRDEIMDRGRELAAHLAGCAPVLDLGCGRGELLEVLAGIGVEATGVEGDRSLVELCRERGLRVVHADAVEYLAAQDDNSLGGIAAVQLVEHLTPQQVVDVAALAWEKLRPGGRVVVESANPQSLYTHAHALFADPARTGPVHPAYLDFLFRQAGFETVIEWRNPVPADDAVPATSADAERLNRLLFAPQDYAVVATRP